MEKRVGKDDGSIEWFKAILQQEGGVVFLSATFSACRISFHGLIPCLTAGMSLVDAFAERVPVQ